MYWAIQLSIEMQNRVMRVFHKFFKVPEGWEMHCDHITIIHSSHKDWMTASKLLLNFKDQPVKFTLDGIGISESAIAFKVNTYTANKISHITIATAPGAKPVESNNIENWEKLYCTEEFEGRLTLKD